MALGSTHLLTMHYGPRVHSSSNRKEYQEYFQDGKGGRCLGLTILPPSRVHCLEIWEPQPPGTLRACKGIPLPLPLTFTSKIFLPNVYVCLLTTWRHIPEDIVLHSYRCISPTQ